MANYIKKIKNNSFLVMLVIFILVIAVALFINGFVYDVRYENSNYNEHFDEQQKPTQIGKMINNIKDVANKKMNDVNKIIKKTKLAEITKKVGNGMINAPQNTKIILAKTAVKLLSPKIIYQALNETDETKKDSRDISNTTNTNIDYEPTVSKCDKKIVGIDDYDWDSNIADSNPSLVMF